jgi:O-antigen ligase
MRNPHLGRRLRGFVVTAYATLTLVPFLCVADQALASLGLLPINPTLLCVLVLLPLWGIIVAKHLRQRTLAHIADPFRDNAYPLLAFSTLSMVALALSLLPSAYWGEGGKWIFMIPYSLFIVISSMAVGAQPALALHLHRLMAPALGLLVWSIWYDFSNPGTFAEITNRAAGFPGNANFSALVGVTLCCAALDFGQSSHKLTTGLCNKKATRPLWGDILLLATTFIIVALTMSRSGLIHFTVLFLTFIYFRLFRSSTSNRQRAMTISVITCAAALIAFTVPLLASFISQHEENNRLARFLSNKQVDDGSAGTRLNAVIDSIRLIEESPVLGHGTGYSRTMLELPHNLYLQQWVNNGIVGLLAYVSLLLTLFLTFQKRNCRNGQALILVATTASAFSHNVLDQRPFLIALGTLLASSQAAQQYQDSRMWRHQRQNASMRSLEPFHLSISRGRPQSRTRAALRSRPEQVYPNAHPPKSPRAHCGNPSRRSAFRTPEPE